MQMTLGLENFKAVSTQDPMFFPGENFYFFKGLQLWTTSTSFFMIHYLHC